MRWTRSSHHVLMDHFLEDDKTHMACEANAGQKLQNWNKSPWEKFQKHCIRQLLGSYSSWLHQ